MLPAVLLFVACRTASPPPPGVRHVDTAGEAGLSGLTVGPDGQAWAVSERPGALLQLDLDAGRVTRALPLTGLSDGAEPESVAVTASGALWIGTETGEAGRRSDAVVRVEVTASSASVVERDNVPWRAWGLEPEGNRGLEGLCAVGEVLVVAGEPTRGSGADRQAPLGVRGPRGWAPHWLPLRSDSGKVSALWCEPSPEGGLLLTVIERHYEVLLVHQAHLPEDSAPGSTLDLLGEIAVPEVISSLSANFEGLARHGEGWLLLSDNQSRTVTGPTRLVRLP